MKDDSEHVVQCITALNTSLREHKNFKTLFREGIFFCSFLYMSLSWEVSGMQKTTDKDQFWWEGGSRQWQVLFSQILKVAYIFCCAVGPYTSNHDSSVNGPVKKKKF